MADLLLRENEQAAVRAVLAAEPVPGTTLPCECALDPVARLIPCDAIGIALLDGAGSAVEQPAVSRDRTSYDVLPMSIGPPLGVQLLERAPVPQGGSGARGISVLSYGVRTGPDLVVKLWLVRRSSDFTVRDRVLLALVAPALERLMRQRPTSALPPSLTLQERRVLRQVAGGLSNAEIAERLSIAPCTVRKHLENAYRKLGVTNRLAAVLAIEGGRVREREPAEVELGRV